jgi:hypothetical protein
MESLTKFRFHGELDACHIGAISRMRSLKATEEKISVIFHGRGVKKSLDQEHSKPELKWSHHSEVCKKIKSESSITDLF